LHCGNCCSTTSPIFIAADIDKLARHLRKTPGDFIEKFLIVDSDDGHFMLRQTPCPFLGSDKYCSVYESRPRACAGFPHTDRRGVAEILPLILRNAEICPAVAFMLCRLCPR
jgi:Fe-S-cluster containining protein